MFRRSWSYWKCRKHSVTVSFYDAVNVATLYVVCQSSGFGLGFVRGGISFFLPLQYCRTILYKFSIVPFNYASVTEENIQWCSEIWVYGKFSPVHVSAH